EGACCGRRFVAGGGTAPESAGAGADLDCSRDGSFPARANIPQSWAYCRGGPGVEGVSGLAEKPEVNGSLPRFHLGQKLPRGLIVRIVIESFAECRHSRVRVPSPMLG